MGRLLSIALVVAVGMFASMHGVALGSLLAPLLSGAKVDSAQRPVAPDFRAFYSAAHFLHQDEPNKAYDYDAEDELSRALFGPETNLLPWRYPPPTLLMVRPLGGFNYAHACLIWMVVGVGLLLLATFVVTRRADLLLWVVISPSVAFTVFTGQIGLYLTALLLLALGMIERAPRVAGVCLGALILKPHMAVLVPVLLWAHKDRQLFVWTVVSTGTLAALSVTFYGVDPWRLFVAELGRYGHAMLDQQNPQWDRIPSVYILVRELGTGKTIA